MLYGTFWALAVGQLGKENFLVVNLQILQLLVYLQKLAGGDW